MPEVKPLMGAIPDEDQPARLLDEEEVEVLVAMEKSKKTKKRKKPQHPQEDPK